MDKTSFKIFVWALFVSLAIFVILFLVSNYHKDVEEETAVQYVTNPNIFFTVESCVNKYIQLLIAGDKDSIYDVIDETYKNEKGITINNVLANNVKVSSSTTFTAQKILEDQKNKNTYYVKGFLTGEFNIDEDYTGKRTDYTLMVILDMVNYTYSIIPDDVEVIFHEI